MQNGPICRAILGVSVELVRRQSVVPFRVAVAERALLSDILEEGENTGRNHIEK